MCLCTKPCLVYVKKLEQLNSSIQFFKKIIIWNIS
jgi:hypothetical protein